MTEKRFWFKGKRYGWGWTPVTWQGWLVTAFYALVVIWYAANASSLNPNYILIPIIATIFLFFICYKTGEKPRWRWGK